MQWVPAGLVCTWKVNTIVHLSTHKALLRLGVASLFNYAKWFIIVYWKKKQNKTKQNTDKSIFFSNDEW